MNDKLNDKDIDNLFRNSLESSEVVPSENFWTRAEENILDNSIKASIESSELEPSDNFWTKAYESILQRESIASQASLANWRRVAVGLACLLVGFIGYSVYLTGRVNDLGKQVANMQTNMIAQTATPAQNNTSNATIAINNTGKNEIASQQRGSTGNSNNIVAVNPDAPSNQGNNAVSSPSTIAQVSHKAVASSATRHTKASKWNATNTVAANTTNKLVAYNVRKNAYQSSQTFDYDAAQQMREHNMIAMLADPTPPTLPATEKTTIEKSPSQLAQLLNDDSYTLSQADSAYKPGLGNNAPIGKFVSNSKISLTAFAAPAMAMGYQRAIEHQKFTYSAGLNVGYDLSTRFTLTLGCAYQSYSFYTNSAIVNSIGTENGVDYQVITSSGAVDVGHTPQSTDKISALANGNRSYLEIPVQIRYSFTKRSKLKVFATAGVSANILVNNSEYINFVNPTSGNESLTLTAINGSNALQCGYMAGIGAEYKTGRGIALSLTPMWMGAITPVNRATPIKTYPAFLELQGGISYHF